MNGIDLLRYQLYCAKGGKVDPDALPPCKATLSLHINRANYQAAIWRRATMSLPVVPPPSNHGWIIDNDTDVISVRWLKTKPAPEEILDLLSCICKKCCKVDSCYCMQSGLECTDLCLTECNNMNVSNTGVENAEEGSEDELSDVDADDLVTQQT